jgi:hypothetical protein
MTLSLEGLVSESHLCIDCGIDTAPGCSNRVEAEREAAKQIADGIKNWSLPTRFDNRSETYMVHDHVWKAAGVKPYGGCLCIGCLEQRIGRRLIPDDFANHALNTLPGTPRLMDRRGTAYDILGDFPEDLVGTAKKPRRKVA